jgi:hypothetical protein
MVVSVLLVQGREERLSPTLKRPMLTLDLRDIDPNSVSFQKMPEGFYAFSASTTNDELKIEERVGKSVTIQLNPDYGPSFTQAFKQAVILAVNRDKQPGYPLGLTLAGFALLTQVRSLPKNNQACFCACPGMI